MGEGIYRYLEWSDAKKEEKGLKHTVQEIVQQPKLWADTAERVLNFLPTWHQWKKTLPADNKFKVVLSGAGTSNFVGVSVQPMWQQNWNGVCQAWPTTRIVTEPKNAFNEDNVLLVSFARSGNNPETIASVNLASQLAKNAHHLAITCNHDSFLARLEENRENANSIVLHPDTRDKGLAMTSSFTNLVLAGLIMGADDHQFTEKLLNSVQEIGLNILKNSKELLQITSENPFDRVMILGDGALYGTALEGVLKITELTDGNVLGTAETFLGARHGRAAIVKDNTLVIYLLSSDTYIRAYQKDVIKELSHNRSQALHIAISLNDAPELREYVNSLVVLNEGEEDIELHDNWRTVLDIMVMQMIALQRSLDLNIPPDNPFRSRATKKAVAGVNLIPYQPQTGGK